jgi:hypothetical protein
MIDETSGHINRSTFGRVVSANIYVSKTNTYVDDRVQTTKQDCRERAAVASAIPDFVTLYMVFCGFSVDMANPQQDPALDKNQRSNLNNEACSSTDLTITSRIQSRHSDLQTGFWQASKDQEPA